MVSERKDEIEMFFLPPYALEDNVRSHPHGVQFVSDKIQTFSTASFASYAASFVSIFNRCINIINRNPQMFIF